MPPMLSFAALVGLFAGYMDLHLDTRTIPRSLEDAAQNCCNGLRHQVLSNASQ